MFHSKPVQHVQFHSTFGLLTQNATWCQNRGCICISSIRRTYGRIQVLHTSTIILQTELFPKKRRENIQGENFNLHSSSNPRVFPVFLHAIQHSTRTSVFPHAIQSSRAKKTILHTELILLQEMKYYNYKVHSVHTDRRHPPTSVPRASKHSTRQNQAPSPLQYMQASSNSRQQKQHSKQQPASTHTLQSTPGFRILQGEIGFFQIGSSFTYHCNTIRSVCSNLLLLALRIILQEI